MNPGGRLFTTLLIMILSAPIAFSPVAAQDKTADDKGPTVVTQTQPEETYDAFEGLNRMTSSFNRTLREWVIDPVVEGYQAVTPDEVQTAVSNVVSNLSEPLTAVSSVLQGDVENAGTATSRFLINSTIGVGGIVDRASEAGLEQRREDLGQSMGVHGVGPGPHIVLPIIGPSNFRDATGDIAAFMINPLPGAVSVASGGVEYADNKDTVKAISDGAVDPYIAERDSYEQNRKFVINNGQKTEVPDIPDIPDIN